MAERKIGVLFQSRYEGSLKKHLEEEKKSFAEFQQWLDKHAFKASVQFDWNGIKAQVSQIGGMIATEISKSKGASILGPDGRSAQASVKELSKVKGLLQEISTFTYKIKNKQLVQTGEFLKTVEQIGNGMERINRFKRDDAGDWNLMSSAEKDVRTVKQLEDGLRAVNKQFGQATAGAAGRGDKSGQLQALQAQKRQVDKLVREAAESGLVGSSAYTKAESRQTRLGEKIAGLEGRTFSDAEKKSRSERRQEIDRAIKAEEARATAALKANKLETDHAERLLPDRVKYEAEINRLYQERAAIFKQSKGFFQQMDKDLLMENRPDLANKAFNRGLNAQSQINQADLDLNRALTDSQRRGQKELEKDKAGQLKADVDFQRKQQDEYQAAQAKRLKDDVEFGQKRIREQAAREREAREGEFRREIQDIKAQHERRIAEINRAEKAEIAASGKNANARLAAIQKASSLRQSQFQSTANRYGQVEYNARNAGFSVMADSVRGKALSIGNAAAKDMDAFEQATRRSGHALDFHSSSLLRNAGTFLRWQIPMKAVMAVQQAFAEGVSSAIRVDRQYATLQTVFNGTAQEAALLKKETLDLAVAQGRSADEAMDSSIRWSRLGMTRIQVLEATRVSLMASNVAEISAAEAAEKLSGIYATYKLNVGDLSVVLNRLNSISNNYNVTVKDLFEGIARVSGVAKQSGLELRDLEGIIGAVTGASGRPGQEIGNALKMVITRLGDPEIAGKLKKAFDIDLAGPNGDLKSMSQILRELADVYPTLNRAEQQRFLMLTAGSRQASRMAQVMTEYRQAQVLTAQAAMDHGASERENEKILESLQSRLDSVATSWTNLVTALGDAGGFEAAGNFLRYIQQIVMGVTSSIDDAEKKTRGFAIQNPMYAEAVEKLGGAKDGLFQTGSRFTKDEVERALRSLKEARSSNPLAFDNAFDILSGPSGWSKEKMQTRTIRPEGSFLGGMELTDQEIEKLVDVLEKLLEKGGDTGFSDNLKKTTKNVTDLRNEVDGLRTSSWTFSSLSKGVADGSVSTKNMVREFQGMANLMLSLPDGQKTYNDAMREFNDLAKSGDREKLSAFLMRISNLFAVAAGPKADLLRSAMAYTVSTLDQQVAELEAKKAKLLEGNATGQNDQEISQVNDELKNTRSMILQVNAAVEDLEVKLDSAFGVEGSRRITNYLDDVMSVAKAFGEAFKDYAPDAEGDPVERVIQRHLRALEMGREALVEIRKETNDQSEKNRRAADSIQEPAKRKRVLDQQDEADMTIASRIQDEDKRLEQLRRELQIEEAILRIKRAQGDAAKAAEMSAAAFRFGETESDKSANLAKAVLDRGRLVMSGAEARMKNRVDSPQSRAAAAGSVLQDEVTARRALEDMERRNYEIDAARRQIAYDLVKAQKEQTNEASKRFQLASREDQLRASVLARTLRGRGVSDAEFTMLGQTSRQALTSYLPNQSPGLLNEPKADAERRRKELDEEQKRLRENIAVVRESLKTLAQEITRLSGRGGAIDPLTGVAMPKPLQDATRDQSPVVNFNLASLNIQVKLAEQFSGIVNQAVDRAVSREVSAMETRLRDQRIPNPQGAVE